MWPTRETCTRPGAFSASLGTHDEISQVPTVPTDASNATILELSADMIPHFGAFVRVNLHLFVANSRIMPSLARHRANRTSTTYCKDETISHAEEPKKDSSVVCGQSEQHQAGRFAAVSSSASTCDFVSDHPCNEALFPCTEKICRHYMVGLPPNYAILGGKSA